MEKNENSLRWKWFRTLAEFEEILEMVQPKYAKYKQRIASRKNEELSKEYDVASYRNRHNGMLFDPFLFMEAVIAAVNRYTGMNRKGERYNFAQSVNWRYHKKLDMAAKNTWIDHENAPISMEREIFTENGVICDLSEAIPGATGAYESLFYDSSWIKFLVGAIIENRFTNPQLTQAFISRDILIELKLYRLPETLRKEYEKDMEPDCLKWCPMRAHCPVKGYPKKCYVRYGRITGLDCCGNPDLYELMKLYEDDFFLFLDNAYVRYAFRKRPACLHDIYMGELRDFAEEKEHIFKFTNEVIAKALGVHPSTVSRGAVKYESEVREKLRKIVIEKN